jgi:hypothetical protein
MRGFTMESALAFRARQPQRAICHPQAGLGRCAEPGFIANEFSATELLFHDLPDGFVWLMV